MNKSRPCQRKCRANVCVRRVCLTVSRYKSISLDSINTLIYHMRNELHQFIVKIDGVASCGDVQWLCDGA